MSHPSQHGSSKRPDEDQHVWQLIDSAMSSSLSAEEQAELAEQLAADPAASQLYTDYCLLHTDLHLSHVANRALAATRDEILREAADAEETAAIDTLPTIDTTITIPRSRRLGRRQLSQGIVVAVCFVLASLSIAGQIILPERVAKDGKDDEKSSEAPKNIESIARLVGGVDAKWDGHVENPVFDRKQVIKSGMKLYPGQELKLVSGSAEFKFFNGAEVTLEGPAVFEVQGKKQCGLTLGKLVAKANEERSKGFIVETPTGRVEDLGTEFAVAVDKSGNNEVVVFSGEVDVQTESASGDIQHTRLIEKQMAAISLAGDEADVRVSKSSSDHPLTELHRQTQIALIRGVTIHEVSSELIHNTWHRAAIHTVDGSGLKGRSHVNRPDQTTVGSPTGEPLPGSMWLTVGGHHEPNSELPESIVFDLGAHYDLAHMRVWNYNETTANLTSRGVKDVEISASPSDAPEEFARVESTDDSGAFVFPRADGTPSYRGFYVDLRKAANPKTLKNVRFIRFHITSNHGPNPRDTDPGCVGLSEIHFFGAPVEAETEVPKSHTAENAEKP